MARLAALLAILCAACGGQPATSSTRPSGARSIGPPGLQVAPEADSSEPGFQCYRTPAHGGDLRECAAHLDLCALNGCFEAHKATCFFNRRAFNAEDVSQWICTPTPHECESWKAHRAGTNGPCIESTPAQVR